VCVKDPPPLRIFEALASQPSRVTSSSKLASVSPSEPRERGFKVRGIIVLPSSVAPQNDPLESLRGRSSVSPWSFLSVVCVLNTICSALSFQFLWSLLNSFALWSWSLREEHCKVNHSCVVLVILALFEASVKS